MKLTQHPRARTGRWLLPCVAVGMASVGAQELPAEHLLRIERPLVIAHRGYSALAPENTLPAFKAAVEAGADLVELDYRHSRDAVPIVIHDSTLDRTTDAVARWGGKDLPVRSRAIRASRTPITACNPAPPKSAMRLLGITGVPSGSPMTLRTPAVAM